jgi:hypothetical protein
MKIGCKNPLNPLYQFYKIMGPTRFERVTSRLSAVRSTWLSYGPDPQFALMIPLITVSLPSPKRGMLEKRIPASGLMNSQCKWLWVVGEWHWKKLARGLAGHLAILERRILNCEELFNGTHPRPDFDSFAYMSYWKALTNHVIEVCCQNKFHASDSRNDFQQP